MVVPEARCPARRISRILTFSLTQRLTNLLPGALLGVLLPGLTFAQSALDPARFAAMFSDSIRWLAILAPALLLPRPAREPGAAAAESATQSRAAA